LQIQILSVGKIKEQYLNAGIKEYLKRLTPYAKVEIHQIKDEKAPEGLSSGAVNILLEKEAAKLEQFINPGTHLVALDISGQQFSSTQLAHYLKNLGTSGQSNITFLIGGSLGLSPRLLKQADLRLSFSPLTFPHQLFRLILLEQLYRSFKIIRGEPYHK
jgi:23S rRNA (pseudouridine1915-N3)-methyltransferase